MGTLGTRRKSRISALAIVHFTTAKNKRHSRQLCVYAECILSGVTAGPIWSHSAAAVRRCLATLTAKCECGRRFHKQQETTGARVLLRSQ